jgi:tRNA threonylcarbamoyladenosine biosynthesis protein TsaE
MFNDPEAQLTFELADEAATEALAARVAAAAAPGDVIALIGDLGAGKTVFARAFIRARCNTDEEVPSPTFTLLQTYDSANAVIYHFDLYRLSHADDALELGIEDAFADGISLIEWAERLGDLLPADRLDVQLHPGKTAGARRAQLIGHGYWRAKLGEGISEGAIHA